MSGTSGHQRSIKVLHVVLSLNIGGLERGVLNQVREGQLLGQRVAVLCLDEPGALASRVADLGAVVVSLRREPGLRIGNIRGIRAILRWLMPDVVHTHQLATLLYAGVAARSLRVPVVVHTEHGKERYDSRWKTRILGRTASRFCDRFYCLTTDIAQELRRSRIVDKRKIRVIHNGIDVDQYITPVEGDDVRASLSIPADAPLIGTVGRLSEVKRQDVLIRAFARTRRLLPNAHLVIVGDGPLRAELESLARELRVEDGVHFAGFCAHSAPYLHAMDLFALTSRSEGMPQAVLEASVVGLPVVASRVGGLPEVVEDGVTGVLFPPGDDLALADAVCSLLQDPDRCRTLGDAARKRVSCEFSVRRMAGDYHRDFLELLGCDDSEVDRDRWHELAATGT